MTQLPALYACFVIVSAEVFYGDAYGAPQLQVPRPRIGLRADWRDCSVCRPLWDQPLWRVWQQLDQGIQAASTHPSGIVGIYGYSITLILNIIFQSFTNHIKEIPKQGQSISVPALNISSIIDLRFEHSNWANNLFQALRSDMTAWSVDWDWIMNHGTKNWFDWGIDCSFRRYFHYSGSLTTPPCSEGVKWFVSTDTSFVTEKQLDIFRIAISYHMRFSFFLLKLENLFNLLTGPFPDPTT